MPTGTTRTGVTILSLVVLGLLTWNAGRSGFASFLTAYAAMSNQLSPAHLAVGIDPNHPDARYIRATILEASDLPSAIADYYQTALNRPADYVLWLRLARARELNGDAAGAILAARQALPLAPHYAEPHYQLGNILLRANQTEEAFKELRIAGHSNPRLMPGIIDLAWRISKGDVGYVQRVMAPERADIFRMLGDQFRRNNEIDAAITMYTAAGDAAAGERHVFLYELIEAKRFSEAARLWGAARSLNVQTAVLIDPGFEQEGELKEAFGWRQAEQQTGFHLNLDTSAAHQGKSSLRIEFDGEATPAAPLISQLVLVDPGTRYQLRFAVRAEKIISGGLPVLVVMDANTKRVAAQSDPLPNQTDGWREYTLDFETDKSSSAVQIMLQRHSCKTTPCPIFGRLWLDDFSLKRL